MIDLLLKAVDRIIDLAKIEDKRIKARYEEIYEPSFEELRSIHADYLSMFTELGWKLRKIDPSLPGNDPLGTGSPIEALEFLSTRRIMLLPIREKLSVIGTLLQGKGRNRFPEVERRFIQSLADYFVVGGLSTDYTYRSQSSILLDRLESIISRQVDTAESITQEGNLESKLSTLSDIREECQAAMKKLDTAWYEIVNRFNELRLTYTAT
jgi:hypothetical protein